MTRHQCKPWSDTILCICFNGKVIIKCYQVLAHSPCIALHNDMEQKKKKCMCMWPSHPSAVPLHLFVVLLLPGLSFHLLHLDGVGLSSPHVQLVVTHTQCQNALVDAQTWGIKHKVLKAWIKEQNRSVWSIYIKLKDEYLWTECDTHRCFLVDGFDDKLLVIERDVSNLTPGESNLWCQSGWNSKKLVNCADF